MNFVITKIVNRKDNLDSWRIHPIGDFYKTLLIIKHHDLKDILTQIVYKDPSITHFLKTLLKEHGESNDYTNT